MKNIQINMKLTITSIKLKSPFHFFTLANQGLQISRQLNKSEALGIKKTGFWTTHYTMTLWPNEKFMRAFVETGAHLKAMKES